MPGRLTRRRLLQLSGASAATGGLAAILASGRAPAYAQGTTVHWLKFVDFVPVSDQLIKGKIKDECQKALGISLHAETIDGNGIQARTTSAIQSGSGPDIIMEINNWPQLYADSVIDVSDIAEEIGQEQGGYYDTAKAVANDGKKWVAMPHTIIPNLLVNRTSWFADIGVTADNFPQTWDAYRDIARWHEPRPMAGHSDPVPSTLGSVRLLSISGSAIAVAQAVRTRDPGFETSGDLVNTKIPCGAL